MIDDIKEYIIREYPAWKIKTKFRLSVDSLINEEYYIGFDRKLLDYELFYDIEIEKRIVFEILGDVSMVYKIEKPDTHKVKEFICEYMSMFFPIFKKKWEIFKRVNLDNCYNDVILSNITGN